MKFTATAMALQAQESAPQEPGSSLAVPLAARQVSSLQPALAS